MSQSLAMMWKLAPAPKSWGRFGSVIGEEVVLGATADLLQQKGGKPIRLGLNRA